MRIPHLTHTNQSYFYPLVREAVRRRRNWRALAVALGRLGGFNGRRNITIAAADELEFDADVELNDWTYFPARIRAAATALRDAGLIGVFQIEHQDGQLTIRR
jgi:hypothetical protein